jgi:hypothetical protein
VSQKSTSLVTTTGGVTGGSCSTASFDVEQLVWANSIAAKNNGFIVSLNFSFIFMVF